MISGKRYIVCTNWYPDFKLPFCISKIACWWNTWCIKMLLCLHFLWSKPPHPALAILDRPRSHSPIAVCVNGVLCSADCGKSLLTHSPWCLDVLPGSWVTPITYTTASTSKQRATISPFACGRGRRTGSPPATASASRYPRSPVSLAYFSITNTQL